jgi:hypothetical protein
MLDVAQQTAAAANKKIYIGIYFVFILFSFLKSCDHFTIFACLDVNRLKVPAVF